MDAQKMKMHLQGSSLSDVRYFETIDSTNRYALEWLEEGAQDQSLVIAEEQTAGRGRMGRRWFTPSGSALAFSLILRPNQEELEHIALFSLWFALSLCHVLHKNHGLHAQVKWPNDVLLARQKIAGILAEASWHETKVDGLILGMGVNVSSASVPPSDAVMFPATCVEKHFSQPVDRYQLIRYILEEFFSIRSRPDLPALHEEYTSSMAFLGEMVRIVRPAPQPDLEGKLMGITPNGDLRLVGTDGMEHAIQAGDVHLRVKT